MGDIGVEIGVGDCVGYCMRSLGLCLEPMRTVSNRTSAIPERQKSGSRRRGPRGLSTPVVRSRTLSNDLEAWLPLGCCMILL